MSQSCDALLKCPMISVRSVVVPVLLLTVLTTAAKAAPSLGTLPMTSSTGPLAGLPFARDGKIYHAGSWDRKGGNDDRRPIAPGGSLVLLDYQGAGVVRRFWVTIDPEQSPAISRGCILRCYWDGEKTPSVEVPIGDFFGQAFGKKVNYVSLPLNIESGGMNCYWPMPFHRSARIVVDNESPVAVGSFYYNMEVETHRSLPKEMLHFHARWNRENPTRRRQNYTILDVHGRGQYVGTYLEMTRHTGEGLGFLEGDEMVYVDGEKEPSINGTGTEDYFSSGWYFNSGPYSAPYHGCILKEDQPGHIAAYRWHIEDAIPFGKSIRFTIEHGSNNDTRADYASVAYWYQDEPHSTQPPILPYAERLPDFVPPAMTPISSAHTHIAGEDLLGAAKATSGDLTVQDLQSFKAAQWPEDSQLWWHGKEGAELQITVPVAEAGAYDGSLLLTQAADYGSAAISVNGQQVATFNGYHAADVVNQRLPLGTLDLKAGDNILTLKITGKDPGSSNYLAGIGELVLTPHR